MILRTPLTVIFSLLLLSAPVYSQVDDPHTVDRNQMKLNEAFIMITVTSDRGSSFYKVMTDRSERPYLNIKDLMEQYLDFTSVSCDPVGKHCQGTMQPSRNIFWINGKQSEYGDAEQGPGGEKIPEGAFVVQDGSCWLRYDIWQKWLPLTATWDYHAYYLSVIPEFKLLSERKKMREREIELSAAATREKDAIQNSAAIKPDDIFRPELKYHSSLRKYPQQDVGWDFNYDANIDILRGTFQTGGPVTYDKIPGWNAGRPYWVYRLRDQGWFYLMEVGDTYFEESNLLLPNISGNNGFRFDSREMTYGAGRISVNGRAQQNTVVDLYRDGFYLNTVTTGTDGRYVFDDIVVNSSSRLVAKLYFPDGSEELREIVLSDDNGMILPAGVLQERVFTAETVYGRMNYAALRYGLFDNVTIGAEPMFFANSKNPSFMADLAMRPMADTVFLGQGMFTGKNIDRAFRVNTTLLYPNYFEVEHRFFSNNTPAFLRNIRILGEYWAGRHSLSIGRFQFIDEYEQYKGMRDASVEIIYTFNRYLKPFFNYGAFFPQGLSRYNVIKVGFDVMPTDHSVLEISRTWMTPIPINLITFFVRNIINVGGWDIGITWNIPDRLIKSYLTADVMYRITKNLSLGVLSNDQYLGFRVNWDGIISQTPGPETWSDFAMGTLSGKITSPKTTDAEPYPVQNANIVIGSKLATTDENGNFNISGITPYQKLIAKVDPITLDASVAPEKEFDVIYFRPGTQITWMPKLLWTAGIDGTIEGLDTIPPDLVVEAIKLPDNRLISKGKVESDGFFIVEKLTQGRYRLKLKGLKEEVRSIEVEIPENTNWLSGIKWKLGDKKITEPKKEENTNNKNTNKKIAVQPEPPSSKKYYTIGDGPLHITQGKKGSKGLDGYISGDRKIPSGLMIEAVSMEDEKVVSRSELMRNRTFIVEDLNVGKYELRLTGVTDPPKPIQVEIDEGVEWLSGVVWDWSY
ncbi:MAG: hypothetical protein NTY22_05485 [Proteobacteria bacterium]|nr:hypothetical protein [Pseudomonadota bacterium]